MASIIRGHDTHVNPSSASVQRVAFDLEDMTHRADDYVRQVRSEAAKIVQEAHAEAAQVRRKAEQAGRKTAEKAIDQVLSEMVGKQIDTLRPAVDKIVKQMADSRGEWLDHWQSASLTLAVKIAERLVHRELTQHPEISEQWMREALSLAAGSGKITLRLNPGDHAHLAPRAEEVLQSMGKLAEAEIVADKGVSIGGCLVETRHGSVDMRLESQLERVIEELS